MFSCVSGWTAGKLSVHGNMAFKGVSFRSQMRCDEESSMHNY